MPPAGYLSEDSKRRFTLAAGILGAAVFIGQTMLPAMLMFAIMMPMFTRQELKVAALDQSAWWQDQVWFVEQTSRVNWTDLENTKSVQALVHVRTTDLERGGPPVALGETSRREVPALLATGARLWIVGEDDVRYYEGGSVTTLAGTERPPRASHPFAYGGAPAVVTLGRTATLHTLRVQGTQAEWVERELSLDLPTEMGALRAIEAQEADGRAYLFAQLCSESPQRCSILYRELAGGEWRPALEESCACEWRVLALGGAPAIVAAMQERGHTDGVEVVTLAPGGPRRERVDLGGGEMSWSEWRPLAAPGRLFLVSETMPGSLRLREIVDGRVVRTVRKPGAFPFAPNMMLFMLVIQALPILLSLVLALVLTAQMRRHRVGQYEHEGVQRDFATLWQRAVAQLVDAVPAILAFAVPAVWFLRVFADPETMLDNGGAMFPLWFLGGFLVAFMFSALLLVAYSYLEGRFGKTPGKWLMGIRVVGTDLQPCGFGRALLRNFLTFVDGFFNFLVGALLVAFTENWQRLGDFAARTIVVTDPKR